MRHARQTVVVAVLAVAATVLGSASADAQPGGPGAPRGFRDVGGPGMLLPVVLRAANLTPDQDAQVRQILAAHRPAFRSLREQLRAVQEAMADKLFGPGGVQTADFAPLLQQSAQLREQLVQEGLKVALEVRAVLTPDQLAKASQVKDRLKALRAEERLLFEETK
ncbi:MAG TPA: periplasmic heavy metal sensor [Methylomirabilota bacterium]|jgi:Spy/CpxP family protein refolding chaperone|nr:periplasmic heavy metal sensor [Methylomirabilota bacterium]